ncbi:MAG: class I SAM-dependent methyltransferase [Promethearchaeota archaeon]
MLLNDKYKNDGISLIKLNNLQRKIKKQIEEKIDNGIYKLETIPCAICKSTNFQKLAEKDRYGLYNPVVICTKCGLVQTNPRMTIDSYENFYNKEYRKLYSGKKDLNLIFSTKSMLKGKEIYKFLKENKILNQTTKNPFLFEVGCGAGLNLLFFRKKGFKVQGIDISKEAIEFGRNKFKLDLYYGALKDMKFDAKPNIIIYSHVLEHILDLNKELSLIHDILSDGGILYIEVPGIKNLLNSYDLYFLKYLQNAHVYHFTLNTLNTLLNKNGFELVYGDESIKSVFKKINNRNPEIKIKNDYKEVLEFLYILEYQRLLYYMIYMLRKIKDNLKDFKIREIFSMIKRDINHYKKRI